MKSFYFLFFILSFSGCKATSPGDTLKANGVVQKGIPVGADGCGDMIVIDSVPYKAIGIPAEFLKDGLEVKVRYIPAEPFRCGRGGKAIPSVKILSIRKK